MRKEVYGVVWSEVKGIEVMKEIELWKENVEFMEEEEKWEGGGVFVELWGIEWNGIVGGVE